MLTHIDKNNRPSMVDVGDKAVTRRVAVARAIVSFPEGALDGVSGELRTKKGPVFDTAIVAGVMAAKRTHELVPFCHPIGLEDYAMFVPYRTVDEWYADELKQTPETIREYQRTAYYDGSWKPEYDAPMQLTAGFTLHPDYARVAWVNALTYDMIFTQPVVDEFSRVRVPTRLIIGTRDRTALGRKFALPQTAAAMGDYTQLGKRARDAIPNSQLIELAGVGHCPQVESFDAYSDALLTVLR